ncbi:hypothetical protein P879_01510 [Paragonimus westermani]|uniref:PX domain-containing protein n=1 Tax=Paragonimus westermani TaxID=34504 RepID=A0A8T0DG80_9TREM|nr:hypothetical protein P879_01510 [Paragonimus westermani]
MSQRTTVRVRDFERSAGGHVYYVIEVNVNERSVGNKGLLSVNRRYSDFDTLRRALRNAYPTCILPPLPEKTDLFNVVRQRVDSVFTKAVGSLSSAQLIDQFLSPGQLDASSIAYRCRSLEAFLRYILSHHRLCCDALVLNFLRYEGDWTTHLTHLPYNLSADCCESVASTALSVDSGINFNQGPSSTENSTCPTDFSSRIHVHVFTNIRPHLLKDRGSALKAAFKHLDATQKRLTTISTHAHRLHQNYAEALCQWSSHEREPTGLADVFQTVGHGLASYSSLMDTANEEDAEVAERSVLCASYGVSLTEVHEAYLNIQKCSGSVRRSNRIPPAQMDRESTASVDHQDDKSGSDSAKQIKKTLQPEFDLAIAGREVLDEVLQFEALHSADLRSIFHLFACLQFRRAERCLRIWERIHARLQNAANQLSASKFHS